MKITSKFILCVLILLTLLNFSGCNTAKTSVNMYKPIPKTKINQTGLTWPEGQAIPTTAPLADTIDMVYASVFTNEQLTTLSALQGLVNRENRVGV